MIERSKLHSLRIAENAADGHGRRSPVFSKSPRTNELWKRVLRQQTGFVFIDNGHGLTDDKSNTSNEVHMSCMSDLDVQN